MFTGIIESIGIIKAINYDRSNINFSISDSIPKLSKSGSFSLYISSLSAKLGETSSRYFCVFLKKEFLKIYLKMNK